MMFFLATHAPVHGAADHAHDVARAAGPIDPQFLPYITAILVFGAAFVILYIFVWPKITKGLDDRSNKIRQEIESAEMAREQAKAALSEYQSSLANARDEANAMIAKAKTDAKLVADELRTRNQAELVEMKQRATREIESAKQAAISEIYNEASNLAVSIAGKILEREINDRDQKKLIDDSLGELARAGRG
jgi:F-type H+-transporting ATPase subunit b